MFSREQYAAAAEQLGCEPAMIEAVCNKEVQKQPYFTQKGRKIPKILYEKHVLWELLEKKGISPHQVLRDNPSYRDVLGQSPYQGYGKYINQYQKRDRAMLIDREAAFGACSYGSIQIMGYHHAACGYHSAEAFDEAMQNPDNHLPAFVKFILSEGLEVYLQKRDFEGFAKRYNGPAYWKKGYHIELSRLYQRILAKQLPRHESTAAALIQSQTVQRAAATVATAAAPTAPLLLESGNITDMIDQVKTLADQGQSVIDQVGSLHQQAEVITSQLGWIEWLPWLSGGWALLLVILFGFVMRRYLLDRGYL